MLIGLAVIVVIVLAALPFAVPAAVEYFACSKISEFGFFPEVRMSLGYCWRNGPGLAGELSVALMDTPWRVQAQFGASCSEWSVAVSMPETAFSEEDPVLKELLRRFPVTAVSNLTFSGSIALDAKAERTFRMPVPVWSVKAPVRNLSADMMCEENEVTVSGFSVTPAVSGIADHYDIAPMFPRARALGFGGFALTNFHASVRASERALTVSEASAGFCGGKVNVYSLFLDPKSLNTGFTVFLDDIDAGEALSLFKGFAGSATGRLHGKIRLFVKEGGKAVRLSNAFLYSTPGEVGKLQMENTEIVTDNLVLAGIDAATRGSVSNALTDLDYSVLKLDLKRGNGKNATLAVRVSGTATRGELSVPVDLTINFHGELEQMINIGLGYSKLMKGKKR